MLFIEMDKLKSGARLAKPIYNRDGVLLFDRNTVLSTSNVASIKNFGLIGVYVLEAAEPLPEMSKEDIEFERFQTINVFSLKSKFDLIKSKKQISDLNNIVIEILGNYGSKDHKINFIQNLRSRDDFIYKHSLNVAIISALIANKAGLRSTAKVNVILAALVHEVGKLLDESKFFGLNVDNLSSDDYKNMELSYIKKGYDYIEVSNDVKKILYQFSSQNRANSELMIETRILKVADIYDTMTSVNIKKESHSEVETITYLMDNDEIFDQDVVNALTSSINILVPGTSVEMTNGEKGIVISENCEDILRPIVLIFGTNTIYDLSNISVYKDVQIKDIMKTMDNRAVIDKEALNNYIK